MPTNLKQINYRMAAELLAKDARDSILSQLISDDETFEDLRDAVDTILNDNGESFDGTQQTIGLHGSYDS